MANSEIYRDLLLKNRHGLAFWKPDPNANLPDVYMKRGISIGDLGLLTDDGGFDYLFNIHAEAHDAVNAFLGTPPSFRPLPLDTSRDVSRTGFKHPEKACITRNTILRRPTTDVSPAVAVYFIITEENAAMLVLPHGADRYELEAKAYEKYKAYSFENAVSWYEYINKIEQRGARNGSLYLVTGCDKARSWGLAAGSDLAYRDHERTVGFSTTAGPSQAPGAVGFHASWRAIGGVETRHYPPSTIGVGEDRNQCVFARGFVIGINEKRWADTVSIRTGKIASSSDSFLDIDNTVPSGLGDLLDSEQGVIDFDDSDPTSGVIIGAYPEYPKPVLSPGTYICEHLLSSRSDIDVVLVHDNDWIRATESDAEDIFTPGGTDYEHLAARVLEKCHPEIAVSAAPSQADTL